MKKAKKISITIRENEFTGTYTVFVYQGKILSEKKRCKNIEKVLELSKSFIIENFQ